MRFGLLGTVTVTDDEGAGRPVGSAKLRALLAALLATPGRAVPLEALRAALWGDTPPATATASLHNHVARLRRLLAEGGAGGQGTDRAASRLRAVAPGYLLDVAEDEVDAEVFLRHHAVARAAHRAHDWCAVLDGSADALALWRGDPLSDVPVRYDPMRAYAAHLTEARLQVLEWRFDAELSLGHHQGLTAELGALAAEHPLRESFHRQWMLALHRTHRQAEALAAFHQLRRTLVDELGVEPGPAVQQAYQEILASPPAPAAGPAGSTAPAGLVPHAPLAGAPSAPAEDRTQGGEATATEPAVTDPAESEGGGAEEEAVEPQSDAESAARRTPPAQLPADIGDFTGRGTELAALLQAMRAPHSPDGTGFEAADGTSAEGCPGPTATPRVAVVSGMGGIGKTALAVHAAHLLRAEFPDGLLYADLRGFGAGGARQPQDLLARFLADLGEDAQPLPDHPDDRAALLRHALHGRRVLLVLDNAGESAQVTPLLPGGGGSAVIV
ncbi:MAG TPA: transcriptional regulator, partial [Streptomyces sp.]